MIITAEYYGVSLLIYMMDTHVFCTVHIYIVFWEIMEWHTIYQHNLLYLIYQLMLEFVDHYNMAPTTLYEIYINDIDALWQ